MPEAALVPASDFDYNVRDLFRATAEATLTAQKELDGGLASSYLSSCETDGHRMLFTIPRTSILLRFGITETSGGGWRLLPWKQTLKREQMHVHELRFSVDAVTDPPPRFALAEDASPVSVNIKAPYFMLTPAEEKDLAQRLLAALDPNTRSWISVIPGAVKDIEKKVLQERAEFAVALGKDDSERGPVFFRYDSSPSSFLVVRVVGKDANDSVFVVTPTASPQVVIHSLDGDEVKGVRYQPLHHLLQTIRRWQEGALPPVITTGVASQQKSGLRGLVPFAEDIRAGYAAGLDYLSDSAAESFFQLGDAQLTPSVYYDFSSVLATLTYSLGYTGTDGQQTPTFDFQIRRTSLDEAIKTDDGSDEVKLIESRARVRAWRDQAGPRTEIELEAPEFVLSGAAHNRLAGIVVNSDAEIRKAFQPSGERYSGFLQNDTYRRRVVALLSYRGSPPKEEFLVVWPGEYAGASRDFGFTCRLNKTRDRLDNVKKVFGVEDELAGVQLTSDNADVSATGEQYRPFHNFFHSVRIWRARTMM